MRWLEGIDAQLRSSFYRLAQRRNHGLYAVNINASNGFFAQLNWCLYIFAHCEHFNLRPYVVLSSRSYTTSERANWLDYFFINTALTDEDRENIDGNALTVIHASHIRELGLAVMYGPKMSLEKANRLLNRNMRIRPEIEDHVERFCSIHFSNRKVLGVHYRGTDKAVEAPAVRPEQCIKSVREYLRRDPAITSVFVSSDEESFVRLIQNEIKGVNVVSHDDSERSRDGLPVHAQVAVGDNHAKGREALVNCLLLSRCDVLIRTASFLSGWCSVLKPSLPVMMLNEPYPSKLWFPDREVLRRSIGAGTSILR